MKNLKITAVLKPLIFGFFNVCCFALFFYFYFFYYYYLLLFKNFLGRGEGATSLKFGCITNFDVMGSPSQQNLSAEEHYTGNMQVIGQLEVSHSSSAGPTYFFVCL